MCGCALVLLACRRMRTFDCVFECREPLLAQAATVKRRWRPKRARSRSLAPIRQMLTESLLLAGAAGRSVCWSHSGGWLDFAG
jgi:hypothetical protein